MVNTKKRYLLWVFLFCLLVAAYSFFIEPIWLEVTHHTVSGPVSKSLKIAHLTDFHFHTPSLIHDKILSVLAVENPDVILITGDSFESPDNYELGKRFFRQLQAPLGIYTVNGNWENWEPVRREREFYRSMGIRLLKNESVVVRDDVELTGFDDFSSGDPQRVTASNGSGKFRIAAFHSPSFVESPLVSGKFEMAFSGHSHGGQIRLPFLSPLWLPFGCGRFVAGWYQVNGTQMYVSRGIGMSMLPIRLLSRPEIAIVNVTNE